MRHRVRAALGLLLLLVAVSLSAQEDPADIAATPPAVTPVPRGEPVLSAEAAILMDATTGRVLWERNSRKRMYPASLTKMMSGLLAVEAGDLSREVVASEKAAKTGESSIALAAGEKLTLYQVLQASLIKSANDATVMLAESVAGSEEAFVARMNHRAQALGLRDTHFTNPHGLHHDNHYSTAYDQVIIAREGLKNTDFADIVATSEAIIPWPGKPWSRKLPNRNRLLLWWDRCDGVKTGYTRQAGRCLAASATEGQWRLVCVVLKCQNSWQDARSLLAWGFANYRQEVLAPAGRPSYNVRVTHGRRREVRAAPAVALTAVVRAGETPPQIVQSPEPVEAPVTAGQVVGTLSLAGDTAGYSVPLVAVEPVARGLLARLFDLRIPHIGLSTLVVLAAGVLIHGASAKATRARRRRQQARKRTPDRRGASYRGRSDNQPGRPGRPGSPDHMR